MFTELIVLSEVCNICAPAVVVENVLGAVVLQEFNTAIGFND